jgi:hypothetical protein
MITAKKLKQIAGGLTEIAVDARRNGKVSKDTLEALAHVVAAVQKVHELTERVAALERHPVSGEAE